MVKKVLQWGLQKFVNRPAARDRRQSTARFIKLMSGAFLLTLLMYFSTPAYASPCRHVQQVILLVQSIVTPPTAAPPVNAFFIGNSGTDEIGVGIQSVFAGSGVSLSQDKFSIPGAPLPWLWHYQNQAGKDASPLTKIRRLKPNHLIIMPIYRAPDGSGTPVDEDYVAKPGERPVEAGDIRIGSLFYAEALKNNPDARLWLYSVWPSNQDPKYRTAAAWDAWGTQRYQENQVTRAGIAAATGGHVDIIPAAAGLAKLRDTLQQTQPQFIKAHFEDALHLSATGRYFVGLLFYAYTTGRNPVTTVTDNGPLSAEVAAQYKQVAWQTRTLFPPTDANQP